MNLLEYSAQNHDLSPATEPVPVDNEELEYQPDEPFDPAQFAQSGNIVLRDYQQNAVEAVRRQWTGWTDPEGTAHEPVKSTLLVLPTGTGKTVVFSSVIHNRSAGKAMVIAHREELIFQGKRTIEAVTGAVADVEMADFWAGGSDVVIATVQTLSRGRVQAFKPSDFSLLIIDEAHHATAGTYQKVCEWFKGNENLKILGVTATPDRADEEALGKVFESVAFDYELPDAVRDGWLVPVLAQPVAVAGLDYSSIRTTAGDLNGADLEAVMMEETPLHKMTQATIEIAMGIAPNSLDPLIELDPEEFQRKMAEVAAEHRIKKCLVFCVTVKHAERLAEILNRWIPNVAQWVCGKTDKDERRQRMKDYKEDKFKILVNVGCCTEGFDEPTIEVIVIGRPTKSRCLFSQMVGRGTRALPGVVDGPPTPELRRAAIAASAKPNILIVDFSGNTGRHQLVCATDILGGNYDDDVIARARAEIEDSDDPKDVEVALRDAQSYIDEEKTKEAARRAKLLAKTKYIVNAPIDAFAMFKVSHYRERGWEKDKVITEKMRACLEKQKIWKDDLTFSEARQLIQGMALRREQKLCSLNQLRTIQKHGFGPETLFADASKIMDTLAKNGWRLPEGFRL